jgi:hypothetical protein
MANKCPKFVVQLLFPTGSWNVSPNKRKPEVWSHVFVAHLTTVFSDTVGPGEEKHVTPLLEPTALKRLLLLSKWGRRTGRRGLSSVYMFLVMFTRRN